MRFSLAILRCNWPNILMASTGPAGPQLPRNAWPASNRHREVPGENSGFGAESFHQYSGHAAQCAGTSRNGWDRRGTSGSHPDPPQPERPRSRLVPVVGPPQEWDSALLHGELQQVPGSPFLQPFKVALDGRTTPWPPEYVPTTHSWVTCLIHRYGWFFLLIFCEIQNKLTLRPSFALFWIDDTFSASLLAETEFVVSFWKISVTLQMLSQEKAPQLEPISLTMNISSEHIESRLYIKKWCN